jgi:hydrogenase maturation factor
MRPGGKIVLTKSVAIEGTAILAHDREEAIRKKFGEDFLARAKAYFDHLSILKEAMIAFRAGGVMSMHDPTEGGLAGGLNEMADAAGVGFEVYDENIPIAPETKELCRLFKINPLALISSGSLLIVAEQEMSEDIVRRIRKAGIQANIIGKVCADSRRRVIIKSGRQEKWLPMPHSDELWIALSRRVD